MYHIFDRQENKVVLSVKKKKHARLNRDDYNMSYHQITYQRLMAMDINKWRYIMIRQKELL